MMSVGDAITKAKRYVAHRTGVLYRSLVLEASTLGQTSHVTGLKARADLGAKRYGYSRIEGETPSGATTGFKKSRPNDPKLVTVAGVPRQEQPDAQFEIVKDTDATYRFLLRTPPGDVIAFSKAYASKADCLHGVKMVKENTPKATIHDPNEYL
jgi:uncharacterized protein YegP (UPF0339 family)